jgi:L,D-transpeptidase ErfK/SrfK
MPEAGAPMAGPTDAESGSSLSAWREIRRYRAVESAAVRTALVACLTAGLLSWVGTAQTPGSPRLVGTEFEYVVRRGDTLRSLGSRFGIEPAALARMNNFSSNVRLKSDQILDVDPRHVVPEVLEHGLLINVPQRMLFVLSEGAVVARYPVGLGRPDWPTPVGPFSVMTMEVDPVWDVPLSIQEEMRREGKNVVTRILPGPNNPLGHFWIGVTLQNLGLHGTIAPLSIYRFQSHGCIRLHPDDVADLFPRVTVGMPGEIIYEPVLLARGADGELYLEIHRDVYNQVGDLETILQSAVERLGVRESIDWDRARDALRARDGLVRDVSRSRS